jgi:hypothetical protein
VRNHQRGASPRQLREGRLHSAFALVVEGGGRLVEDQDRRILQEGPGDGQPLLLAAGERYPALADVEISPPLPNSRQYQAAILPGRCEDPERAAAFIGRRLRLGPYLLAGMSKSRRP